MNRGKKAYLTMSASFLLLLLMIFVKSSFELNTSESNERNSEWRWREGQSPWIWCDWAKNKEVFQLTGHFHQQIYSMQIQTGRTKATLAVTFRVPMLPTQERSQVTKTTFMSRNHTNRTFDLTEPGSDEVAALLGRRAARETGSGEFQLHRNTEATTSWHSVRLWGGGLLDERMDEWAWKIQADRLTKTRFRDRFVSMVLIFLMLQFPFFKSIMLWLRDWLNIPGFSFFFSQILTANRFFKSIFSNAKELAIDSFSFSLIIWFEGRIDESADGAEISTPVPEPLSPVSAIAILTRSLAPSARPPVCRRTNPAFARPECE